MGMKDGKLIPIVQEMTLNTYTRFNEFNAERADAYWAKTKDYWAAVRAGWDAAIKRGSGSVRVTEVAETGSEGGVRLMGYADEIDEGKLSTAQAIEKAQSVISEVTAR